MPLHTINWLGTNLDRAAWSCILHATNSKMSVEEAEFWGRYAYQLAATGPYKTSRIDSWLSDSNSGRGK